MLCAVIHPDLSGLVKRRTPELALEEAVNLAEALDVEVVTSLVVKIPKPKAGTLFGKGKVEELEALFAANDVGLVIVDGIVTPVQQRNLEEAWDVKVLDRTGLIQIGRASCRERV